MAALGRNADEPQAVIDIADIRDPVLTPLQRQACEAAEATPVVFDEQAILDAAREKTGLTDFGDEGFRSRLRVWLQSFDEDKDLSALGRAVMWQMSARYAETRLRIEDLIKRNPEILDIEIDRPIIVMGLPRSGTTYLVSLLSADSRLRSLPWWEAIAPVPTEEDRPTPEDPNPRWTRAEAGWQQLDALLPYMKALHGFEPDHISEDLELSNIDFSSYLIEWFAHVPRWRDYYLSHDLTGSYAYLKRAMQVLTFLKGPNRWVIKCPAHMEQIPAVTKVFPDATYVVTHRDPVASIQSAFTVSTYADRLYSRKVDADRHARYLVDRYKIILQRFMKDADRLPAAQTLNLYYHRWIGNPDEVVRAIYNLADLPLTDDALRELKNFQKTHEYGHKGRVVFNLRRDMRMTPEEIRREFDEYFEKFPVAVEVN